MEYESLLTVQGYAKFGLLTLTFIVFYSYAYSMYKRDKSGDRDFESYSNLVLDDSIESKPLEDNREERSKDEIDHVSERMQSKDDESHISEQMQSNNEIDHNSERINEEEKIKKGDS